MLIVTMVTMKGTEEVTRGEEEEEGGRAGGPPTTNTCTTQIVGMRTIGILLVTISGPALGVIGHTLVISRVRSRICPVGPGPSTRTPTLDS